MTTTIMYNCPFTGFTYIFVSYAFSYNTFQFSFSHLSVSEKCCSFPLLIERKLEGTWFGRLLLLYVHSLVFSHIYIYSTFCILMAISLDIIINVDGNVHNYVQILCICMLLVYCILIIGFLGYRGVGFGGVGRTGSLLISVNAKGITAYSNVTCYSTYKYFQLSTIKMFNYQTIKMFSFLTFQLFNIFSFFLKKM